MDCLEAAAQGSAHSGGVGSHTDFGGWGTRKQARARRRLRTCWLAGVMHWCSFPSGKGPANGTTAGVREDRAGPDLTDCKHAAEACLAVGCAHLQQHTACSRLQQGFCVSHLSTAPAAGVTGRDSEDIATLLSSSWRKMRSLVLQKRNVQEFQFRQYLFAAQVRAGWQGCAAVGRS